MSAISARVPVTIVVAAALLVVDAVTRVIEIPTALFGVAGPGLQDFVTPAVAIILAWLLLPVVLAVVAAALLLRRRRAALVLLIALVLYVLVAVVSTAIGGHLEPVLVVELVGLGVVAALVLVPRSWTWLTGRDHAVAPAAAPPPGR